VTYTKTPKIGRLVHESLSDVREPTTNPRIITGSRKPSPRYSERPVVLATSDDQRVALVVRQWPSKHRHMPLSRLLESVDPQTILARIDFSFQRMQQ
jgi:hypothetical protein